MSFQINIKRGLSIKIESSAPNKNVNGASKTDGGSYAPPPYMCYQFAKRKITTKVITLKESSLEFSTPKSIQNSL